MFPVSSSKFCSKRLAAQHTLPGGCCSVFAGALRLTAFRKQCVKLEVRIVFGTSGGDPSAVPPCPVPTQARTCLVCLLGTSCFSLQQGRALRGTAPPTAAVQLAMTDGVRGAHPACSGRAHLWFVLRQRAHLRCYTIATSFLCPPKCARGVWWGGERGTDEKWCLYVFPPL